MGISALGSLLDPAARNSGARAFRLIHHSLLAAGVAAAISISAHGAPLSRPLLAGTTLFVAFFFLAEWLLRLAAAPAMSPGQTGTRLRYLFSFGGAVDLAAGIALPLALLFDVPADQAATAGTLWTLKLTRYVAGFALIGRVVYNERGALSGVFATFAMVLLLAGTAEHLLEGEGQPAAFGSLPAALWWCIVTLTTTGYGDAVPATTLGRVVAGAVMIVGIAIFAMWAGILASGFAAEVRRRDFLQNWALVAKVPLFKALGAAVIAEVARRLRPRRLPAGGVLMRKGEPGDCMYFIVDGEVEVAVQPEPVRLGAGAFLGEMALITGEPRTATVTARQPSQLLVLDIADFRELAGQYPDLTRAIEAEADRRRETAARA